MTDFATQLAHSTQLAMTPGFWQFTQQAVQALEADRSHGGMYSGLRAAVASAVKAQGYKPARHELTELWISKKQTEVTK